MEIDKDVPIPDNMTGRKTVYPFREMEAGDSLYFEDIQKRNTVLSSAIGFSKRNKKGKWKYGTAKEGDGFRIWRIK